MSIQPLSICSFTKPVAFITGASKRIGKQLAVWFSQQGYDIILHVHHPLDNELIDEFSQLSSQIGFIESDLTQVESIRQLIEQVEKINPPLSILVNNASIFERTHFTEETLEDLEKNLTIHLKAPFLFTQLMNRISTNGLIINLLDAQISANHDYYFSYNLSKKALKELTLMSANALAPKIRVNAIALGTMLPPKNNPDNILAQQIFTSFWKANPLAIEPTLDYLISAIDYLIKNKYVTGEVLYVDGGKHLQHSKTTYKG